MCLVFILVDLQANRRSPEIQFVQHGLQLISALCYQLKVISESEMGEQLSIYHYAFVLIQVL